MATTTETRSSPFRFFKGKKDVDKKDIKSPAKKAKVNKKTQVHADFSSNVSFTPGFLTRKIGNRKMSLDDDPESLIESLQAIGDDQPKVARSIPKNSKPVKHNDRSLKDCLYTQEVYDGMLEDSLKMCDLLASHFDECMESVRRDDASSKNSSLETRSETDSGRGASSPASPPPVRRTCVPKDV
ncbi:hypothetical protein PENTCL1PPCAC_27156 [Pristionchus entomophagus]|uniref:Uncharacterized protein n=1 Tax=Pristionchus entomophagus TaxID=358040 RepID=A0AAV5UEJ6_9BILA|nr:hypothetical protein PENTCL1PPCAC_27156 [Pristionchus entomophagus]